MSNRTFIVLSLRLIILLLLFQSLSSVGAVIYSLAIPDSHSFEFVGFQLSVSVVYLVALLALFKYENRIADRISKGVSESMVQSSWTSAQLMTIVLSGVAAFVLLSSIPIVINQLYSIVGYFSLNRSFDYIPKNRLNDLFVGFLGTILKLVVAATVFVKARRVASLWERWQSAGGLTSGSI